MAAKASGVHDEALGTKVNWVSFEAGTAMSAAMASGDIQNSLTQGVPPFVVAASAGQTFGWSMWLLATPTMTTASWLQLSKSTKTALANWPVKKVAVPLGTAAHYGFLRLLRLWPKAQLISHVATAVVWPV